MRNMMLVALDSVNDFVLTFFYSQLPNIFCNWLNATLNPRCILSKNLVLFLLANVLTKLSNNSIDGNCSLWLIHLFRVSLIH